MDFCVFTAASPRSDGQEMMMFASRDRDIQRLEEEVRRLQRLLQEVQERTANHIALLQQQLANKSQDIERLQAKLQSQQDYEKIKTELRTLRALTQTADDPHVVSVSSPPSDVSNVSVDNDHVIQRELHYFLGKEEPLSESCPDISGLPVENRRSPSSSSSSSSVSLHMFIKEENDSDGDINCAVESDGFMDEDEREFDTARIAQQVKEALQQQNIGQRVFGHYVLGLSQGTVSDILARPKPWSKLTSRGREPFLRMKHFLSDEHSIHTLRIIQERLRGIVPWVRPPEMSSDEVIRNILDQSRLELMDVDSRSLRGGDVSEDIIRNILHQAEHEMQLQSHVTNETARNTVKPEEVDYGTLNPSVQSPSDFVQSIIRKVKCEMDVDTHPSASPASLSSINRSFRTLPVDSGPRTQADFQLVCVESCEDESLTGLDLQSLELDTSSITQRVKEALALNNIGQRVFGEEVLGLTQSSVSELLSHPKPWTKLSLKGKENFIRMHRWLQDPHNVQRLTKIDQRARLKRDSQRTLDGHGFCLGDHTGAFEAVKRPRVVLSVQEKDALRAAYQLEPYPSQYTIERLASQLGLQTSTVSNWFYNYRSRIRRDGLTEPVQTRTVQSPASTSPVSSSLVPIKQEPSDPEMEDDTQRHTRVSVAVQAVTSVKTEKVEDPASF
ncbi:homeobox protein cut-like 2 isoform X1 [Ctenopharyngodon idella]|uniref:homeobox protein cut-like 2 isoform X1 n=2 Tax=Ctenopharyngodon idella TaxID=7959 RepID=UPI00222F8B9F|nr:homeobox protein cut-like 2 isoform X1 [Ctenopharyngodon idella]